MTVPSRSITSEYVTETGLQLSKPFRIMKLTLESATHYLSEGPSVSFGGQTYLAGRIAVDDLKWGPDGSQTASVEIYDEDQFAETLIMESLLIDAPVEIYTVYAKVGGGFTTPLLYVKGVSDSVNLGQASLVMTIVTSSIKTQFAPNRYFTKSEGFNYLIPEGTIITWNGQKYVLQGEVS